MATLRERLSSAAFGAGWDLVSRLPESVARGLFNFGADIAWRREGRGVQVLEGNLTRILGTDRGSTSTPGAPGQGPDGIRAERTAEEGAELRALSRAVLRSYARYYLETFRMQVIPAERIATGMHVNFDQADLALGYMKNGRGVIFALPHMGDFELTGRWIIGYGAGSFTTVAERLKPEAVFQRFLDFRQGLGMEVLPTTGGPHHPFGVMAQRLRAGKLVCIVADRDLSDTGVEVDFFGEKALFPAGPASLAVQTGAALMPVSCRFEGEDEWGAHIYDEIGVPADGTRKEKAAAMTQAMATVFEEAIREHPEDWHMLQKVFVRDLDPDRLARSRNRIIPNGNGNGNGAPPAPPAPFAPPASPASPAPSAPSAPSAPPASPAPSAPSAPSAPFTSPAPPASQEPPAGGAP
jgi:lauroyl/myristoyl acyltransferase